MSAVTRRVLTWTGTALAIAVLAAWAVTLRPLSMGGPAEYVVIHGNSMNPTYHEGDLIVAHRHSVYTVGDVVAYHVPQGQLGAGLVVIHRIVGGDATTGYVLRGDNNPVSDPWHPHPADIVGSPWVSVPRLGKAFVAIHRPIVPGLFFGALALIFVLRYASQRPEAEAAYQATLAQLERVTTSLESRYADPTHAWRRLQATRHRRASERGLPAR